MHKLESLSGHECLSDWAQMPLLAAALFPTGLLFSRTAMNPARYSGQCVNSPTMRLLQPVDAQRNTFKQRAEGHDWVPIWGCFFSGPDLNQKPL